jgi:hypothetical protein
VPHLPSRGRNLSTGQLGDCGSRRTTSAGSSSSSNSGASSADEQAVANRATDNAASCAGVAQPSRVSSRTRAAHVKRVATAFAAHATRPTSTSRWLNHHSGTAVGAVARAASAVLATFARRRPEKRAKPLHRQRAQTEHPAVRRLLVYSLLAFSTLTTRFSVAASVAPCIQTVMQLWCCVMAVT